MSEPKTPYQMGREAVSYTEQLLSIFAFRSSGGEYTDPQRDYAIHREGKPMAEDSGNWISTPSVPIFAEDLLRKAFQQAGPDEVESLRGLAQTVAGRLEALVKLPRIEGYATSLSSAQETARSCLPTIRELAGIQEPANV